MPVSSDSIEHQPAHDQDESYERKPTGRQTRRNPHKPIVAARHTFGHSGGTEPGLRDRQM
jgi:hypothetical protein